ncbi:putative disease resistance protein RGA3 [Henckelia pumila]|uniref:putative disease resistance protein RGA3 n=1 Tax=Henckelia pumila TaxID=405737 RepID=UPI003C6DEB29
MADAAVSSLLDRLAPNSKKEARKLFNKLEKIHQVLMDAEQDSVTDPKVKSWLDKVQDISYDIDAVLDEWDFQNLKQELDDDDDDDDSLLHKVSSFLQSLCLCFRKSVESRAIAKEINKLNERLDLIAQENENEFDFRMNSSPQIQDFRRIIFRPVVNVSQVHGRDEDLKLLLEKLVPEAESSSRGVQILSLVGEGGIGKTTLAQFAFNHDKVKHHFDVKIWVCVSDHFDWFKVAKAVLEAVDGNGSSRPNISPIVILTHLGISITGKRFLLVLDDVWSQDYTMWKLLRTRLTEHGAHGSRILLTTRNRKMSEIMGSNHTQSLDPLSDSQCWSIFSQIALYRRNERDRAMLQGVGWEIAMKCKGLPLAARILGSLLSLKCSHEEWHIVLGDLCILELKTGTTQVSPFLALTYNALHPVVKRCFSSCAIFPKDSAIDVDELVRSWMAHGFISSSETEDEMETEGRGIFNDLANRSFFQDFEAGKYMDDHIVQCKMHNVVHDFARFLTKSECFIVEKPPGEANREIVSNKNARHLNLLENEAINCVDLFSICQTEKLRSFLCQRNEIPMDFLSRLKRVRWLRLEKCGLLGIPSEIGDLIHLRYLDLSGNPMKELPETICNLYNLLALNIRFCSNLYELPRGIDKLKNLRHLWIIGTPEILFLTQGFQNLSNLREFDYFIYHRRSKNKLGHLKDLNQLGGSFIIQIYDLDDTYDHLVEAKIADLKNKKFIRHLSLFFHEGVGFEITDALQPSPNLPCLDFIGNHLPNWITTLTNLRKLFVGNACHGIHLLHSLRNLSFLEELALYNVKLERLSLEFFGIHTAPETTKLTSSSGLPVPSAFPKLKKLCISACVGLKEWEDIGDMINISVLPCLEVLELFLCPELMALPHRLLRKGAWSLQELRVRACTYLQERYGKGTGEDWDKISHIPQVHIERI